jgi:aryl-alcohol dehydrogenase-like predicted oxidoreductase
LAEPVEAGKILRWGVSNLDTPDLQAPIAAGDAACATDQVLYNLTRRSPEYDLLFAHPEWGTAYDTDFALAVTTRTQLLADNRQRTFTYWAPIRSQRTGYEWVPEAHTTPDTVPAV